ncbi:UNVERIFIED_CONTAM: putative pentatricopeptide repeat-containing protein [Sesamum calycinum]|uniref:Pentatricopeptide repeat-containing protein n=1 Tax=Sesamum calycinum TaxID=2727403 RepID=A0AAW2JE62_9LAMI
MTSRKLVHIPHLTPRTHSSTHYRMLNSLTLFSPPFVPKPPSFLATNVIKSYFETGLVREARTLFDEMPERDVVAWSAMINGFTSCNLHVNAWTMFREMLRDGEDVKPNEYTFSSVLKACKSMGSLSCGELVHGLALKHGVLGSIYVRNALMDMYGMCSDGMDRACAVFEEIGVKNSVSWTTLIAAYTHLGDGHGGLRVFREMLLDGAELNPFNVSIAIRACSSIGSQAYGKQIHATVFKRGFESSIPVMNSILDMYCRCIGLSEADRCFHGMTEKDIITWNTMIAGYEKSDPYEALNLYSSLEFEGLTPNCFTFTSVIAAVANMAVLGVGEQIHGGIIRRGLGDDLGVANALIDMYAKCGSIMNSCKIFNEMHDKNVVSWTSMMVGYGSHGHGKEAVELFDKMVESGVRPDRIVFVAVLNACSHAGLVDEGLRYFKMMVHSYNITPDQEIYGCIVDLLGRAGRVKEAYQLIEAMPFMPDESVWGAFLGACKAHKLAELGKLAASKVLDSRPSVAGTYLALSSIYAADGKWGDFARIRKLLKGMGNKKEAGRSWIEVRNQTYSFVAGDKLGFHIKWVYEAVDMLGLHMKEAGYNPDLQCLVHDLENEEPD